MANIELQIQHNNTLYQPVCEGEITWTTERKGAPGKLEFTVINDGKISFQEGDHVRLLVDGVGIFYGFVFTKKRSTEKEGAITVTAYDQLRYFKNKELMQYENKRADEVVAMIAGDFRLQVGTLENTEYVIEYRLETNQTLFDIVQTALDMTLESIEKMYVLYDDYGKLTLKNIESMKVDALICNQTAQDFDYSSSIDSNTYNQIKLAYENKETGTWDTYVAKDSSHINDWGVLQMFETLKNPAYGPAKADALLSLYNRKTRSLSIKDAFGDIRVRGGSSVPVFLNLGDIKANTYMIVEQVTHRLTGETHFMDLTLRGNDFS